MEVDPDADGMDIDTQTLSLLESENQDLELSANFFIWTFSGTKIDGNHAGIFFSCISQHIPFTEKKLEIQTPIFKFSVPRLLFWFMSKN